ncbi:MAG TPA: hypothetical protein VEH04_05395 [Verrucomicrobiae bacterium]|nr:hypothetical protein [Verrucomicrobiae bacterium]
MKPSRTILVLCLGALLTASTQAITFLNEPFANYETGELGAAGTGSTGTEPGWNTPQDFITVTNGSGSLDASALGLLAATGDMVWIAASNINNGSYNRFVPSQTFRPDINTNVYYSFLYRFNSISEVSTDGQIITAANRQNSGWASTATFHWHLQARRSGNSVQLGLSRAGGTTTNWATETVSAGQTFLVVIRQQIIAPAATPDTEDLWVNPPSSTFGVDEASVPTPSVSTSDGLDDTSNTGVGRFWIVASGQNANLDELRIANTWAEVTPPADLCEPAMITSSPTNLTQVAGITATFRVVAGGTSPTVQWQISENNGASWMDIPGAVFSSYTTPNLWLPDDNGNQYRAIVNIPCNSSSATSEVASVTLTAPVASPNGLVMHDTFTDPELGFDSRSNEPLTPSNSLWYTIPGEGEESSGLNAFNTGGNLVGTPRTGSSSLWLGYFVPAGDQPIHLDVGQAIRVTLPFIPDSFASHTNNAALRFGLFDYYDAGTRVTADAADISGSNGRAFGVRGYMLSVDFGPTFTANSPLSLLVRNGIFDSNLMGTTGSYASMGSGPASGGYSNAPAFQAGVEYTLEFTVARTGMNSVNVTASIAGGGTNWTHSATETNNAYHRFDSFAIRPNSLETSADTFTFPEFKVEVIAAAIPLNPFGLGVNLLAPGSVRLNWASQTGVNYHVLSSASLESPSSWTTNATVIGTGGTLSYTNSAISTTTQRFYRVLATP